MKHLIIGAGIVGTATGIWLKANCEEIIFCDIKPEVLERMKNRGFSVTRNLKDVQADIYWICTAEWNTEEVLKELFDALKREEVVLVCFEAPEEGFCHRYILANILAKLGATYEGELKTNGEYWGKIDLNKFNDPNV